MNAPEQDRPAEVDALLRGAQRAKARDVRRREEHVLPIANHLAQIGILGWMIVMPILMGVVAGSWLDRRFHTGLFYTAPLLMLGAALGCWWGWRWMHKT